MVYGFLAIAAVQFILFFWALYYGRINSVKYMTVRREFDRLNEWLAYATNPRETPRPEALPEEEDEPRFFNIGKREYEPDDDIGAVADLLQQADEPADFFTLAPEAEDFDLLNIANRETQQVGMELPDFEKDE